MLHRTVQISFIPAFVEQRIAWSCGEGSGHVLVCRLDYVKGGKRPYAGVGLYFVLIGINLFPTHPDSKLGPLGHKLRPA